MSEENVEIVRRMYEAFHAGDTDAALGADQSAALLRPLQSRSG